MNRSLFGGNPHDAEQYMVNPHLVAHLVVVFANLFGDEFSVISNHGRGRQNGTSCVLPIDVSESLRGGKPFHSAYRRDTHFCITVKIRLTAKGALHLKFGGIPPLPLGLVFEKRD